MVELDDTLEPDPGNAGPYRLLQQLGTGGFGSVYEARKGTEPSVAVKIVHGDLTTSAQVVQRFRREIELCRLLDHAGVIKVLDFGETGDGRPYLVMPLLHGMTVRDRVRDRGAFSPEEALAVLAEVCDTLAYAHDKGMIHRDVKDSNVFLTDERVVLLDFGLAKLLHTPEVRLTTSWQVLGTPAYRAPEQMGSEGDERADIYALGVMAFFMLTAELPFMGENSAITEHMHRTAPRPRPSRWVAINPALDEVVIKAMSIEPAQRYQTVREFADAFRRAVDSADATQGKQAKVMAVRLDVRRGPHKKNPAAWLADADKIMTAARETFSQIGFQPVLDGSLMMVVARPLADEEARLHSVVNHTIYRLQSMAGTSSIDLRAQAESGDAWLVDGQITGGPLFELDRWQVKEGYR